jgi:hypothetical protein
MRSTTYAEINSTVFKDGVLEKKVNLRALFPGKDTTDLIGLAADSVLTRSGFRTVLLKNVAKLRDQETKLQGPIPRAFYSVLLGNREIRDAIKSRPVFSGTPPANPFPIVEKPVDYDLSRGEEVAAINREVVRLRSVGYGLAVEKVQRTIASRRDMSIMQALKRNTSVLKDPVLKILVDAWKERKMAEILDEDPAEVEIGRQPVLCADLPKVMGMIDLIKSQRLKRTCAGDINGRAGSERTPPASPRCKFRWGDEILLSPLNTDH